MLRKLLENKRLLVAVVIALLIIITGVIMALVMNRDTEKPSKSGMNTETQKIEKTEQDASGDKGSDEEPYNGNGLEVKEEIDGTIPSVDGSGSWDDDLENSDKENKEDKEDKEDKEEKEEKEENILDDDGYYWTYPN